MHIYMHIFIFRMIYINCHLFNCLGIKVLVVRILKAQI